MWIDGEENLIEEKQIKEIMNSSSKKTGKKIQSLFATIER
jgi:hypothetical protein